MKSNDSLYNTQFSQINLYKNLKNYFSEHTPLCKMAVTKTMIPM